MRRSTTAVPTRSQPMPRRQKLLTADLRKTLPTMGASESAPDVDAVVLHAKFFSPYGNGRMTWWVAEFDGDDTFFGVVDLGMGGPEWGYFSLSELESVDVPGFRGLQAVERDVSFRPAAWVEVHALRYGRSR